LEAERINNLLQKINPGNIDNFRKFQISTYGSRYTQYRAEWESDINNKNLPNFPIYINLESTYICNLQCPSCFHGKYTKDLKKANLKNLNGILDMPLETLKHILQESQENKLPSISLNWIGEPTLLKDLAERIKLIKEAGIMDIIMTTNGIKLTPQLSMDIIKAGVTHVMFSADAISEETYNITRPGGNFKLFLENIKSFHKIRQELTQGLYPITRISVVATSLNEHELKLVKEFYQDKVDYIDIQPLTLPHSNMTPLIPKTAKQTNFKCDEPFKKVAIRPNGDVFPCCSSQSQELKIGNIHQKSIKELFHSELMNKIRTDIETENITFNACKFCYKNLYKVDI